MYWEAKDTGCVPTEASSVMNVFSGVIMPKSLGPILWWWEKEWSCSSSHLEAPLKPRSALLSSAWDRILDYQLQTSVWRLSGTFGTSCVLKMFVTFSNFKGTFLISDSGSSLEVKRSYLLDARNSLGISGDYQGRKERFTPKGWDGHLGHLTTT